MTVCSPKSAAGSSPSTRSSSRYRVPLGPKTTAPCSFERTRFNAFVGRHIDLACALAEDTSERLVRATENMTVIGQLRSTERVAHFLIEIFELYATQHAGAQPLALHFTRHEIADYLGLTLETVSRSFSKLRDLEVIALVGVDSVAILNEKRLTDIAKVS